MNNVNATASCTAKMSVLYLALNKREQYNYINKRCQTNCLLKRETGVIPVRTRHRVLRVKADDHWVTGKGAGASDQ